MANVEGSENRGDIFYFYPERLSLVKKDNNVLFHPDRFDEPVKENLVLNIMEFGVLDPVRIRRNGKDANGEAIYEVIDGRQRHMATTEANKRLAKKGRDPVKIPCIMSRGDDAKVFAEMVILDEFRKDTAPITKARLIQRYMQYGKTEEECAIAFGFTKKGIQDLLLLLDGSAELQAAVESKEIPAYVARELVDLPREEQGAAIVKMKREGTTKGKKGLEAAKRVAERKPTTGAADLPSRPQLKRLREQLATVKRSDNDYDAISPALAILNLMIEGKKLSGPLLKHWKEVTVEVVE